MLDGLQDGLQEPAALSNADIYPGLKAETSLGLTAEKAHKSADYTSITVTTMADKQTWHLLLADPLHNFVHPVNELQIK